MLFDLRGRGRRRTVQVIYIGLAIIFLLGFVGLGVGGGFGSSGIFSAFTNEGGSGGVSHSSEVKKYEKLTRQQPSDVEAWEKLTNAQLHEAGGEQYVKSNGSVTSQGKELFARIASSWQHYLALNPSHPSVPLAKEVLRVYGEEGLGQPDSAVQVLQIIVAAEPSNASYYAQLAIYAYKAKNTRVGDLASQKAVSLAPANQRTRLQTELAAVKKNPSGSETGTSPGTTYTAPAGGGTTTGATTSSPVGTVTTKKK
jgi:hypothetical protein